MSYIIEQGHPLYPLVKELQRHDEIIQELQLIRSELEKASEAPKVEQPKDDRIERLITSARFCLSERIPYVFGGMMNHATESKRGAYDCSSFVQALYKSIGTTLPRVSKDQATKGRAVASVKDLRPGDLLFYDTTNNKSTVNHVALYIGNREMIHTNSPADGINIQNVDTGRHSKWLLSIRRILPESALEGYGD